jgi:hypothetical protein
MNEVVVVEVKTWVLVLWVLNAVGIGMVIGMLVASVFWSIRLVNKVPAHQRFPD